VTSLAWARDQDLRPEDAANYLAATGWRSRPARQSIATLWHRQTDGEEQELLVPLRPEARDYEERWIDLLGRLADFDHKSPETLSEEMLYYGADVAEWRVSNGTLVDFTIPLADATRFINGARDAVVAAASATIQRRSYFGHGKPKQARDYANRVRMGQTRRGSYIIPIISRTPSVGTEPDDRRLDIQTEVEPFERAVMSRLAESLDTVQRLANDVNQPPTMRSLNESVAVGVSSELCGAVANILGTDTISTLDVRFAWARQLSPRKEAPTHVEFSKEAAPIIRGMAESLRQSDSSAQQQIVGYVVNLHREEDEPEGVVTVRAETGSVQRNIKMRLSATDYGQATSAHDERRPVIVTGTLRRESGKAMWLVDVGSFGYATFLSPQS